MRQSTKTQKRAHGLNLTKGSTDSAFDANTDNIKNRLVCCPHAGGRRHRRRSPHFADTALDPRRARAPVAGVVAQIAVAVGERVAPGQPLVCVEAMKMEIWLHAAAAGSVKAVHAAAKASVAAGALLVELEIAE